MPTIDLTRGFSTLVDDADFERVSPYRWYAVLIRGRYPYAVASIDGRQQYLHRVLLGAGRGEEVIHLSEDTLDNRRENIVLLSDRHFQRQRGPSTSPRKTSRYRGGTKTQSRHSPWRAALRLRGQYVSLGSFPSEEQAARAYDDAAKEHFGERAYQNFPKLTN